MYCTGLFSTILSITYLGQGVGNSLCQLSMLVSGLWGVFYFEEIKGFEMISKWCVRMSFKFYYLLVIFMGQSIPDNLFISHSLSFGFFLFVYP